jgi:hypothetical protein
MPVDITITTVRMPKTAAIIIIYSSDPWACLFLDTLTINSLSYIKIYGDFMPIASQLPHFWEDKEGKSHRNMLQIEIDEPRMEGNFPKDGTITIRLQDETAQKVFKMSPTETLQLGEELEDIAKDMLRKKRELWKAKYKQ